MNIDFGFVIPYLPITDLNRLSTDPKEQFYQLMQMMSGFKALPELIQNFSYFYRGPIDNDGKLLPAPSFLQALPSELQDKMDLQYVYDRATGKKMWKYNASWDYFFRQLPETRFLWDMTSSGQAFRVDASGPIAASVPFVVYGPS